MPVKTKTELKLLFIDGAVPTGQDYTDLIDSMSTADGPVPHGPTHKNGGDDEVASLFPAPYEIPKARSNGTLDPAWLAEFHDDHGNLSGLSDDDHPQYLQKGVAGSVTAVHTFNPASISAPFLLGANAIGQKVTGLHADKLDTFDAGNASGNIPVSNTTLNTDLNADMVDGVHFVGSGRTLTVPATGTAALLGEANVFSNMNTFNGQIVSQSILPNLTDTYDLGSSTKLWRKGWLSEMEAVLFAKNTISIVGGWMYIAKAEGSLGADVNNTQTTIDFGQTMTNGNFVVFRSSLQVEYMTVGAITTGTTYNVTRNVDGSGANTWPAGSVYVVLGANGDGRIELNSTDTPRISMIKQGATYNAQTEYVRIGDLNGMPTYTTEKWGIFIGDATNYLKYDMTSNTLTIAGVGTGLTAINGGNIQTGTVVASKINVDGTISLTGSGKLVAGTIGGNRTELSASGLVGYSGASTEQVKIDSSTGKLTAGAGTVFLDSAGISLIQLDTMSSGNMIKFVNTIGGTTYSYLGNSAFFDGFNRTNQTSLIANSVAGRDGILWLEAKAPTGKQAAIELFASVNGNNAGNIILLANTDGTSGVVQIEAKNGTVDIHGSTISLGIDGTGNTITVGAPTSTSGQTLVRGYAVSLTSNTSITLTGPTGISIVGALSINNTTKVTNLNADLVDGYSPGNASGNIPLSNGTLNTNLNSDMLDGAHYSEGTWTPVPTACGASPVNGIGTYVKIGKKVMATFSIPSNNTSSGTTFSVTGLPFTSANTTNHVWAGVCGYAIDNGVALTGATKWQVAANSTTVLLYTNMNNGAWTASGVKRAYAVVTYESAT